MHFILCVDKEGGFAKNGKIPWNNKDDMKHFRAKTRNKLMLCGKNTYDTLPEMVKLRAIALRSKELSSYDKRNNVIAIGGKKFTLANKELISKLWLTVLDNAYDCDLKFAEIFDIASRGRLISRRSIKGGTIFEYDL